MFLSVFIFAINYLLLFGPRTVDSAPSICTSDFLRGSCVCKLADGSGTIDLTPLVRQTASQPLTATNGEQYKYYFAPCNKLNVAQSNCNGVSSSCEYKDTYNGDLGDPESTTFEMRTGPDNLTPTRALVMEARKGGDSNRRTLAFLNCDKNRPGVTYSSQGCVNGARDSDQFYLYFMQLTGSMFCPDSPAPPPDNPGGLSPGSILLIVFFVSTFVYFVGGALLMTFYFKKEGRDRVPNVSFWTALPSYAKEGAVYTWHAILRLTGRYQSV